MLLVSARTLLSVVVIVAFTAACASGNARRGAADEKNTVTSQDIASNPNQPIEQVLQAKVPGVWITRTSDGGIAVQLRGQSTLYGEKQPLYVIDGVPISPGPNGALTGVSPNDIESIQVLKDPAETSMYGMRGANGVIVVKTKRAAKRG